VKYSQKRGLNHQSGSVCIEANSSEWFKPYALRHSEKGSSMVLWELSVTGTLRLQIEAIPTKKQNWEDVWKTRSWSRSCR
jgi:hypothetical protein